MEGNFNKVSAKVPISLNAFTTIENTLDKRRNYLISIQFLFT